MGLPRGLAPMLATAAALPAEDGRWAFEVKWDGVRALVAIEDGEVEVRSRNRLDITASYPELRSTAVGARAALIDGEIVAFDEAGQPDFGILQRRMHVGQPSAALQNATPVTLLVFDVLQVNDSSLLDEPYDTRRMVLAELGLTGRGCQLPPAFPADGAALLASTLEMGLEGIVAKRRDSRYVPGRRSEFWRKVKNVRRQSAVVIGWKPGDGSRSGQLGALLLAVPEDDGLGYAGNVGSGFSQQTLTMLTGTLERLHTDLPPCEVPPPQARLAHWVRPELVVEVEFTSWTRDGRLRHPSYKGIRTDLEPGQVIRE